MNDPLTDLATVPPIPLHGALPGARASIRRIAGDLLAVQDDTLDATGAGARPTPTTSSSATASTPSTSGSNGRSARSRSGGPGRATTSWGSVGDVPLGPAVPALGAMTAARWDLHGVLDSPPRRDARRRPGRRRVDAPPDARAHPRLAAVVRLVQRLVPGEPGAVGEAVYPGEGDLPPEPTEEELATGTLAEIRAPVRRDRRRVCDGRRRPQPGGARARGAVVRAAGLDRLPARSLRLAHPRAHGPGGQDAGPAPPRPDRDRTAGPARPRDLRPARGARHRAPGSRPGPVARRRPERDRAPDRGRRRRRGDRGERPGRVSRQSGSTRRDVARQDAQCPHR